MSKKIKYIKPLSLERVFKDISEGLHEETLDKMDRELMYDRMKLIDGTDDWDVYKSNGEFEKDYIYWTDIKTIWELIGQVILFHRIIKENSEGVYNLPKDEVPYHLRQLDEEGNESDLINIKSGEVFKRLYKKKKYRDKLEELGR